MAIAKLQEILNSMQGLVGECTSNDSLETSLSLAQIVETTVDSVLPWQIVGALLIRLEAGLARVVSFRRNTFAATFPTKITALNRALP